LTYERMGVANWRGCGRMKVEVGRMKVGGWAGQ
jgi:hypothetical protein